MGIFSFFRKKLPMKKHNRISSRVFGTSILKDQKTNFMMTRPNYLKQQSLISLWMKCLV